MHTLSISISISIWLSILSAAPPAAAQAPSTPPPPGNPPTLAKERLGKALFWDEQLGSTRTVACGTCHSFAAGGADVRTTGSHPGPDFTYGTGDDVAGSPSAVRSLAGGVYTSHVLFGLGVQVTRRNTPAIVDAAHSRELHWDGLASEALVDPITGAVVLAAGAALEAQALLPILDPAEMGHQGRTWDDVVLRLESSAPLALASDVPADLALWIAGRDYAALFAEAFGTGEISPTRIAMAIASYERTLVTSSAPIDAGPGALTPLEEAGRTLFFSARASCSECHAPPRFATDAYVYTGVRPRLEDRMRFYLTGDPSDMGSARVPSLRNVELRAPYFHGGNAATLADVVDFYDRGGDFDAPHKSPLIRPLGLMLQERQSLVAFLIRPLTDPAITSGAPPFDRPTLYTETARVPTLFGASTPGGSGSVPRMIALEPAHIHNPRITLAVSGALGGAPAALIISPEVANGVPFQGALLHAALVPGASLIRVAALSGSGPADGYSSLSLAGTGDPALVGYTFLTQWLVFDPGLNPGARLAASEGARLVWF